METVIMDYDGDTRRFHRYKIPEPRVFTEPVTGSIYLRKSATNPNVEPPAHLKVMVEPMSE